MLVLLNAYNNTPLLCLVILSLCKILHYIPSGDILREGWKNILECVLQLYRANLMPTAMYQVPSTPNMINEHLITCALLTILILGNADLILNLNTKPYH